MKTLNYYLSLLLIMLVTVSCGKNENAEGVVAFRQHMFWLSFQDISGNDLLKGSESVWQTGKIKPEFYTLEYIFEEGVCNPYNLVSNANVIYDEFYPRVGFDVTPPILPVNINYKYLWFDIKSDIEFGDFAEKIICRLTCPYLFGNNEAHDIVTWWKPYIYENGESSIYAVCYRVEFGGKEITIDVFENAAVATIVLDK